MNDVSSRRAHLRLMNSHASSPGATDSSPISPLQTVEKLAMENAVVIFSSSTCCMCHVVKRLFCGLGVNPLIYEMDEESDGSEIEKVLARIGHQQVAPTVFVGGKLVGGLDQVMAAHISGSLVPQLKEAGALWL